MVSRFLLLMALSCCVCGLELNVAHRSYQAEEKQSVTLDWTFRPQPDPSLKGLFVFCVMFIERKEEVLLDFQEGVEISESQSKKFSGRVQCDKDVLKEGRIRLHVSSLRTEDSGWYQCEIPLISGSSLDKCHLTVTAITRAPTRAHTRAKASVSETAILPFHLNTTLNKSNLKVTWRFYGTPVISYGSGKLNQGKDYKNRALLFDEEEIAKGNVSLQLKDVTEKDAGKYTCTVDGENINENGFVSLDILIHVTATVNGTAILPVHLRTKLDKPTITVEWKFSDIQLGEFSNPKATKYEERASFFEDEIAEGNISLKLVNITEEDFGKYTCVFHDKNNNEKKFFSFLVKAHINEGSEGVTTQPQTGTKIIVGVCVGGVLVVLVVGVKLYRRCRSQRPAADTASQIRYNAAAPEEDLFIDEPQERQPNNPNSEETERMNVLETRTPTNTTEVVNRRRNGGAIE